MQKLNTTFKINPLYEADSYKVGHKAMLAEGTTKLYGTWIPRSLKYMPGGIDKIMSAGQQLVVRHLHSTFAENFFMQRDGSNRDTAMKFVSDICLHLNQDFDGKHFEDLWDLGYLPIKVKSLPEGIFTNTNIPHMTFVNTVDGYAWLTLFLETYISKLAWQMPIVATIANKFRSNANEWVQKTDKDNMWLTDYMCHDFHSRGGNPFTSIAAGLGHAISNKGSDTLNVIPASRYYYDEAEDSMPIFSVVASEHSCSTTKIFTVGEQQMITDWLQQFPTGILSIVADTFDLWKLITEYLPANKEAIMARDGKLVIRPDSGDPVDIICGLNSGIIFESEEYSDLYCDRENFIFQHENIYYDFDGDYLSDLFEEYGEETSDVTRTIEDLLKHNIISKLEKQPNISEQKGVIELLWDIFGGTVNEQGYKVLDPHIGAIYGDSINLERQVEIYKRLEAKGFAATNIVVGCGSFSYVYMTRDQAGFAAKGSWFEVYEELVNEVGESTSKTTSYNIYKDPVTDDGVKKSLKGLLQVFERFKTNTEIEILVKTECTPEEENQGILQVIYEDGNFFNQTTLEEVRNKLISAI